MGCTGTSQLSLGWIQIWIYSWQEFKNGISRFELEKQKLKIENDLEVPLLFSNSKTCATANDDYSISIACFGLRLMIGLSFCQIWKKVKERSRSAPRILLLFPHCPTNQQLILDVLSNIIIYHSPEPKTTADGRRNKQGRETNNHQGK